MTVLERSDSSVGKAASLINAFRIVGGRAGLTHLSTITGLSKSTTHRLLAMLVRSGLIVRDGRAYALAGSMVEFATVAMGGQFQMIRDAATPHMVDAYERSHEAVHLAVVQGPDVIFLHKLFGHNNVRLSEAIGDRLPASCTAVGKAILAFSSPTIQGVSGPPLTRLTDRSHPDLASLLSDLNSIKERGYSTSIGEVHSGLACIGAPIRDQYGGVVAAISISAPISRFAERPLSHLVMSAASAAGKALMRQNQQEKYTQSRKEAIY